MANVAPTKFEVIQQALYGDVYNGEVPKCAIVEVNGHRFLSNPPGNRAQAASINEQLTKLKQLADPTVPKIESKEADRG